MITKARNKMQEAKKIKKKVVAKKDPCTCIKCGFVKITLSEDGSFCCPR